MIEQIISLLRYDPETGVIYRAGKVAGHRNMSRDGTVQVRVNRKAYSVHRLAWLLMTGSWPSSSIDHIDGNPANNRWDNLRLADQAENMRNKRLRHDNKSGVSGVSWDASKNGWSVYINQEKNKRRNIGFSRDFLTACCIRKSAERALGYHVNHGRVANEAAIN